MVDGSDMFIILEYHGVFIIFLYHGVFIIFLVGLFFNKGERNKIYGCYYGPY